MTPIAKRLLLTTSLLLVASPALGHGAPQQAQAAEQEINVEATEFIFVEGSLPWIPNSNTIVSKLPLSLDLTPNNVGLVTRALFEQQHALVLGNALANVSNVNVQPGFGVHDYFILRGFDSLSSGLILTDGAPEPEATFYQLYNVELVEVIKGPAGFLYGSNPLAGAVNLVRKQPLGLTGVQAGVGVGSFSTREGNLDLYTGRSGAPLFARFNGMVRDDEGYRDGKGGRTFGLNPALTWNFSGNRSLNLNLEVLSSDYAPEAGIPLLFGSVPDINLHNSYNSTLDRSEQDVVRLQADYQGSLGRNVTFRNKFYVRKLDWLSDGTLLNGAFPDAVGGLSVFRTLIQLDDRQTIVGNQAEAVFSFETGSVGHSLLTGVEASRTADDFDLGVSILSPVDLFAPVDPGFPPFPLADQAASGRPRTRILAPYAIDQITVSNRVQLLAGARFDIVDFEDELTGRSRQDNELSPMFGGVWLPHADVSLYGNYSRSFSPPSPRVFGQLEPELSRQVEVGAKLRFLDGRGRATVAVYSLERDNIAIPDDNGFTQQAGNQRSRGFELELAAEPGAGVRAVASYSYNDSELTRFSERVTQFTQLGPVGVTIDRSGNRPAFAPEHLLNVWASKSLAGNLMLGFGARYTGTQFIAEDNAFAIPDALVLGASAAYDWAGGRISLNVQNLTDRAYFVRGFGAQSVTPSSPAAVFVRLDYQR